MNVYYISQKKEKRNTAGAKAPSDIDEVCKSLGYKEFAMPCFPKEKNKLYQKLWLLLVGGYNWNKLRNVIEDESIIIYQHPMYGNRLMEKMIPLIQKDKNAKFIAVIHDLESLRGGIAGVIQHSRQRDEIADNKLLKHFDAIICHNEHMRQYMIKQGFNPEKLFNLEIFDYLCEKTQKKIGIASNPSIAIAGNLAIGKCAYIYELFKNGNNPGLRANLYGINFQENMANDKMYYHGSFTPEELPEKLIGDFGLVWDGNSAETCSGNTGEYLRYNNPHKTSLYLASGIPVIVWSQAAVADFILKNKVGIVIDSLDEIEDKISCISDEEYNSLLRNVDIVGEKIRAGHYIKTALMQAEKVI